MKKIVLALFLTGFLTGCSNEEVNPENPSSTSSVQGARFDQCEPQVFDINAGQHILSGNITVNNNAEFLSVSYNAASDWRFNELHLYVGSYSGAPVRNGNPVPGQFPYKVTFNQLTSTYTFTIPFSEIELDPNGCFIIAAHSSMKKVNGNGGVIQSETGWAGYVDFPGNNWARYFNYCKCVGTVD